MCAQRSMCAPNFCLINIVVFELQGQECLRQKDRKMEGNWLQ